jgi:hypothetical protein
MNVTHYLNKLPPALLFVSVVTLMAFLAGFSTFLFRKYKKRKILKSHNEVTGYLFLAIANFYALFLSFMVFVCLDQLMETKTNLSHESSSALSFYRDIKLYPDSLESKHLTDVYLDFVTNVLNEELPNMEEMRPSPKTAQSFNRVFYTVERLRPKDGFQIQIIGGMFAHLNDLATFQGLRNGAIDSQIPPSTWLALITGEIITIMCAMLLDIERIRLHILLNTLLGTFIGLFFFVIILLDRPFSSILKGSPKSYEQIFTLEKKFKETNLLNSLKAK